MHLEGTLSCCVPCGTLQLLLAGDYDSVNCSRKRFNVCVCVFPPKQVEYIIVKFDHENKTAKVSLRASKVLSALNKKEEDDPTGVKSLWRPEYAGYMIEGTPGKPYGGLLAHFNVVEANMKYRREEAQQLMKENEVVMTLTNFPRYVLFYSHVWYDVFPCFGKLYPVGQAPSLPVSHDDDDDAPDSVSSEVTAGYCTCVGNVVCMPVVSLGVHHFPCPFSPLSARTTGWSIKLGTPGFTLPPTKPTPHAGASRSLFFPDDAIYGGHPRFATLTRNIRERRGSKVAINLPSKCTQIYAMEFFLWQQNLFAVSVIEVAVHKTCLHEWCTLSVYRDKNTPQPFVEDLSHLRGDASAALPDHVYMDAMGFGMGCCCLQLTFQACNIDEARRLYDQLTPLCPIMVSQSVIACEQEHSVANLFQQEHSVANLFQQEHSVANLFQQEHSVANLFQQEHSVANLFPRAVISVQATPTPGLKLASAACAKAHTFLAPARDTAALPPAQLTGPEAALHDGASLDEDYDPEETPSNLTVTQPANSSVEHTEQPSPKTSERTSTVRLSSGKVIWVRHPKTETLPGFCVVKLASGKSIKLALTAASPIFRGYVTDVDARWNVISGAVDCRTEEERGLKPLKTNKFNIPKSRYDSISSYLSPLGEKSAERRGRFTGCASFVGVIAASRAARRSLWARMTANREPGACKPDWYPFSSTNGRYHLMRAPAFGNLPGMLKQRRGRSRVVKPHQLVGDLSSFPWSKLAECLTGLGATPGSLGGAPIASLGEPLERTGPTQSQSHTLSGNTNGAVDGCKLNDIPVLYDEAVYQQLRAADIDHLLAQHIAHLFIRDTVSLFSEKVHQNDEEDSDHFENIQSTNWQTMRFKPPPPNSPIGWRVEFRPCEVQITDFENAAIVCFVVLLTRVILSYQLNFIIPISMVDENMKRAQRNGAVRTEKFWFRKSITTCVSPPAATSCCNMSDGCTFYTELTINEIINGKPGEFPGLIPLINSYLSGMDVDADTHCTIQQYLKLIQRRASGELHTTASWIRSFVQAHPDYRSIFYLGLPDVRK
ncbi:hypothetical protein PR048_027174 [Dryococelus australis]|uniref:glutamate--cysteine ligase n=1 Tax=Dryococelus australis TaxID=614101 RepID=A0ABQ9GEZ1_9NEOP|nr:hypothetical protein PR048_027174 [Dryococelus australis]